MALAAPKNVNSPDNTSTDYDLMEPYWDMVDTILAGTQAMRAAGKKYLPQFPGESDEKYTYRRENARLTNIYRDIVENLAAKPMAKEVGLVDGSASDRMKELAEDIDGAGNNLHVFASKVMFDGINRAVDWIFVDFPKTRTVLTQAQEQAQGIRPYWVHISARQMLAVYSARIGGSEQFVHARWREYDTRQEGFQEVTVERIRVVGREPTEIETEDGGTEIVWGPPTFTVYEQVVRGTSSSAKAASWEIVDEGPITLGVVPLVPFIAGRRIGNSWVFLPALQDCAYLQIEHYQQETSLKSIKELTAFPMLSANGVEPATEVVTKANGERITKIVDAPVGPGAVLYAPPTKEGVVGSWQFIEISATSLQFLSSDIKNTEQQMRELGRQPLTAQTGNLTVITTAYAADKANSVAQAWTLNLKDALEQAFVYTGMWMNDPSSPEVSIDVNFDIGVEEDRGPDQVLKMRESGDLSQRTMWSEMQRYGVLSAEFDAEAEEKLLDGESEGDEGQTEDQLAAAIAALRAQRGDPEDLPPGNNPGDPEDEE